MSNKSDNIKRKFIQSYNINDYEIYTDTGWQDISNIHKTEKYAEYTIETETGKKLSGADNHIVFDENFNEIFLKDLTTNNKIITQNGKQKIKSVKNNHIQKNMYDITVNSKNHRYYTNGILSHNSTTYSIYILWYILTNKDKHVLICANKLDTAIEILQRIQMAYQQLPMWLKPGVITWNKKKIEFSNGCSVTACATSESSGRGLSINCISGNETIDILENGIVYTLPLKTAYEKYQINKTAKILTDTGWSDFAGIIKYQNRQTIKANINNKDIICTADHKIFNGKEFVTADTFPHKQNKNEDVYDIINVKKNNRFLINKDILVHNCLVLDEFAFISPGIEQSFMASVFPIISSSKNSKVIIVSTPNGMNNEFYRIWNTALLTNADQKKITDTTWHPTKIHWSDFPGRDEHWKQIQLATLNHNMTRWNQEFECKFLGSVVTLIEATKIEQFKAQLSDKTKVKKPYEIQIHPEVEEMKINIYVPPQSQHAYIIGADPSTGDGGDYHAMTVWDITNMYNIELVADFHSNQMQPKKFAYILAKTGFLYNCAYIAIENNGVSYATIENLVGDFEYENIVHLGGNPKTNIAIHSTPQLKLSACLTAKELIEDPLRKIRLYNGTIINQMERFEKRSKNGKEPIYGCFNTHDDLMMSMIWAFYCLKFEILQNYYTIRKYATNNLGNTVPLIVISDENSNTPQIKEIIQHLDNTFTTINSNPDIDVIQSVQQQQAQLMNNFLTENPSYNKTNIIDDDANNENNQDFYGFIN